MVRPICVQRSNALTSGNATAVGLPDSHLPMTELAAQRSTASIGSSRCTERRPPPEGNLLLGRSGTARPRPGGPGSLGLPRPPAALRRARTSLLLRSAPSLGRRCRDHDPLPPARPRGPRPRRELLEVDLAVVLLEVPPTDLEAHGLHRGPPADVTHENRPLPHLLPSGSQNQRSVTCHFPRLANRRGGGSDPVGRLSPPAALARDRRAKRLQGGVGALHPSKERGRVLKITGAERFPRSRVISDQAA